MSSSRTTLPEIARGVRIVRQAAESAGRDPDALRGVVQAGRRDDTIPLSGDWDQIRAGGGEVR